MMNELNTFELLEQLSKKPKEEIEYALTLLLIDGHIDYMNVANSYVSSLERIKSDEMNKLIEAESCAMMLMPKKKRKFTDIMQNVIQRTLYMLNKSRRFNMDKMNEELGYDEQLGKSLSWYEMNKNGRNR